MAGFWGFLLVWGRGFAVRRGTVKLRVLVLVLAAVAALGYDRDHPGVAEAALRKGLDTMEGKTAMVKAATAAPAATPDHSGAWMWQSQDDYLNRPAYGGGYSPGNSVSLRPYSSNGGSIAKAEANMAGVVALTPERATSGTLGQWSNPLDSGAYQTGGSAAR
jgi:hypothetical protein